MQCRDPDMIALVSEVPNNEAKSATAHVNFSTRSRWFFRATLCRSS